MEKSDHLEIDGRQLHILLTINAAGSLSAAAKILDMNQSTVSYWLDLLRKRTGDTLFVRAGNGVAPTERAKALFPIAREALRHLEAVVATEDYDPSGDIGTLRIAGSTVERTLIIGPFLRTALEHAPGLMIELTTLGSTQSVTERLRTGALDFAFLPNHTLAGEGIMQRKLFAFDDVVFFDAAHPLEEGDLDAFCSRPQVRIALSPDAGFAIDRRLAKGGRKRKVALQASDFDTALHLLRGTPLIATLPRQLIPSAPQDLRSIEPPWEQVPNSMFVHWHARNQHAARHMFWRQQLLGIAKTGRAAAATG